jgi:hypothetical protein
MEFHATTKARVLCSIKIGNWLWQQSIAGLLQIEPRRFEFKYQNATCFSHFSFANLKNDCLFEDDEKGTISMVALP